MQLVHQREKSAAPPRDADLSIASHSTQEDGEPKDTGESVHLQALRLQLARHGLSVSTLCGRELLLTGPGTSRLAPDIRSAWLYLRTLNGGRLA